MMWGELEICHVKRERHGRTSLKEIDYMCGCVKRTRFTGFLSPRIEDRLLEYWKYQCPEHRVVDDFVC